MFPIERQNVKLMTMTTAKFLAANPVFSLEEATRALAPPGGRSGTVERLKHHLRTERVKLVTRGVYAVVPPGVNAKRFDPDSILVAAAARPDAVFAYHSALELLGAAHAIFGETAVFTTSRRRPLGVGAQVVRFLGHPKALAAPGTRHLGTQTVDRRGRLLRTTGPERTLVEGLRRPALAGGAEELVVSAAGFATLDIDLLEEILDRYGLANLWAATGWFLERFQAPFHVPDAALDRFELRRPKNPQYLERGRRGGVLIDRWNLIMPEGAIQAGGGGER